MMTELYSEKDIEQISAQLKKRYTIICIVLALLLALIVISIFPRIQWLTMVAVFLFGESGCLDRFLGVILIQEKGVNGKRYP